MKHKRSLMSIAMATIVLVSLCAVCASTSVSAAPSSNANVQAPALVGAPVAGAPAVCAQGASSLDLFVKGTDGALWWKHWNGATWSTPTSLGGKLTSDPAAVYRPMSSAGILRVLVRGTDGALWARDSTNGGSTWDAWYKIGGQLFEGTGPAAYNWGSDEDGQIGWFVTGADHALWHQWADWNGRHGWVSLGGYATSSPAATSPGHSKTIDVFVRGGDAAIWQKFYDASKWGGWTSLGGQIPSGTAPAASSWGVGRLDVFAEGTNSALYHKSNTGMWSSWASLGGKLTSSPAAATSTSSSGHQLTDVFVRGTDGALWRRSADNDAWSAWTSVGGM